MYKLLLTFSLITLSNNAMAEWAFLYEPPDGSVKTFIELSSIRKTGRSSSIYVLTSYRDPQFSEDVNYRSHKMLTEFDCVNQKETLLDMVYFSEPLAHGTAYALAPDSISSVPVKPGSMSASLLRIACR